MVQLNFLQPAGALRFRKGDEVFLAKGCYQGTLGTFLNLRTDSKWADIMERNSQVREHPVEWLQHASQH